MTWTELILTVPAAHIDQVGDIANMVVPYGIYVEDYRDLEAEARAIARIDLIDEALLAQDRAVGRVHVYLPPQENPAEASAFLAERTAAAGIPLELETRPCRDEDWENNWKAYFHPLPVGRKLLVQPDWEPLDPAQAAGRAVLRLEPGLAFGSGTHATTRLCLEALEETVRPGAAVLDVGCGSGILAVAALLLGAERAVGVDIDALAVRTAAENAVRNGFAPPALTFLEGNLTDQIQGSFDILCSNIVADVILRLIPDVRRFFRSDDNRGVWISSGIILPREAEVASAMEAAGFTILRRAEEGGWVCFAAHC
ncbi:MAG: 50S ribosomal protein L11 methyltransferase [Oscillospiraceae bacterium]|jgi:ribosomal protein L11 methyltransferase|nr:50S ribosomal protein L11 methyltransferase [Oscillospiraceae bacterium]